MLVLMLLHVNSNWTCFINFCCQSSLKSATDFFQMERQIQQDAWFLRALHVSLSSASRRTVRKCLNTNNGHLITLKIWMEWRYRVWGVTHEYILKPSSEAPNSFCIKSRTWEDMRQFSAGSINKAVPSFPSSWQEYVNGDGRHSELFFSTQKVLLYTYGVCVVLNSWDNFWQRFNC